MTARWGMVAVMVAATSVAVSSPPADAQDMTPAERAAMDVSRKAIMAGRYLDATTVVRPLAFNPDGSPKDSYVHQTYTELQGLMTAESPPVVAKAAPPIDPVLAETLRKAGTADAIEAIVAGAKATRIVILNEDHGVPRDRAFGLEVAKALRPLGYDVLGVETLSNVPDEGKAANRMSLLALEGYPIRTTGYYTRDPVFADFLRQSLKLGYRPVAYEMTDFSKPSSIAIREQAQADYVIARAMRAYPKSKIFLYVGFSHATEAPKTAGDGKPNRWLATRLKAMTGIDPLTIDQTAIAEAPSYAGLEPYALVADRVGKRSVVLTDGTKPITVGEYAGLVDLQVVHPPVKHIDGRPDWIAAMGRTPTAVPADLFPTSGTRLVQAFVASEADDAVPVDQVLVTAGQPAPMLMLPAIPVRYAFQDPTPPSP